MIRVDDWIDRSRVVMLVSSPTVIVVVIIIIVPWSRLSLVGTTRIRITMRMRAFFQDLRPLETGSFPCSGRPRRTQSTATLELE